MIRLVRALAALALAVAGGAWADDIDAGSLHIAHPWARSTAQGQRNGGAYLEIDNHGSTGERLLGVRGDVAESVQLHRMAMEGNVMRMREVKAIDIPAGAKVALAPGGYHVMLLGLKAPLATGSSFPLTLTFEKAGEVTVHVHVESAMPAGHEMKH